MNNKNKKAFTLAELLTAVVIIAILVGILLPALNMARNFAKAARQKVQLSALEVGINMFKNDFGYYPPSKDAAAEPSQYCGAQLLAECMFGYDLMGFHPRSNFSYNNNPVVYDAGDDDNLKERKPLYVDRTNLGVFLAGDVFEISIGSVADRYVICDTFEAVNRTITLSAGDKQFKIGTPILYYRADTSKLDIDNGTPANNIYNFNDNSLLVGLGKITNKTGNLVNHTAIDTAAEFKNYITDTVATTGSRTKPIRPDSFLLISAGPDGLYGTSDDICNFEPNF